MSRPVWPSAFIRLAVAMCSAGGDMTSNAGSGGVSTVADVAAF